MDRVSVAKDVAETLFMAEDAIDGSLKQTARLLSVMIDARRDLRLAASIGDDVVQRTAAAINALAEAREEIVRAHGALAATRDRLGLRTTALGALEKPDDPNTALPNVQAALQQQAARNA